MKRTMFSGEGQWYKGNLHSHTTNSDGRLAPAQSAALYQSYGYDFLCLSEHDVFTDLRGTLDTERFILLPGVEASAWLLYVEDENALRACLHEGMRLPEIEAALQKNKAGLLKTHHIHGILGNEAMQAAAGRNLFQNGDRLSPPLCFGQWDGLGVAQSLSVSLRSRGCFTAYNHPVWSRVDTAEAVPLRDVWAIEVYNYDTAVECGEGEDTVFWDAMLRRGTQIGAFASDDNHNPGRFFDSFGGWVCVRSEALTHEAIVNHLLAGEYYSSCGPEIYQWGIDGDTVFVECSDVARIHFLAGGFVGSSETMLRHETPLRHGEHRLRGGERYIRIECVDEKGRKAWTNPLWL